MLYSRFRLCTFILIVASTGCGQPPVFGAAAAEPVDLSESINAPDEAGEHPSGITGSAAYRLAAADEGAVFLSLAVENNHVIAVLQSADESDDPVRKLVTWDSLAEGTPWGARASLPASLHQVRVNGGNTFVAVRTTPEYAQELVAFDPDAPDQMWTLAALGPAGLSHKLLTHPDVDAVGVHALGISTNHFSVRHLDGSPRRADATCATGRVLTGGIAWNCSTGVRIEREGELGEPLAGVTFTEVAGLTASGVVLRKSDAGALVTMDAEDTTIVAPLDPALATAQSSEVLMGDGHIVMECLSGVCVNERGTSAWAMLLETPWAVRNGRFEPEANRVRVRGGFVVTNGLEVWVVPD